MNSNNKNKIQLEFNGYEKDSKEINPDLDSNINEILSDVKNLKGMNQFIFDLKNQIYSNNNKKEVIVCKIYILLFQKLSNH